MSKNYDSTGEYPIRVIRCINCKTLNLWGKSSNFLAELYDYYKDGQTTSIEQLFDPLTQKSYKQVLSNLRDKVKGNRILDVGCGRGDFVYAARGTGWIIEGIELSEAAVKSAQAHSLPVKLLDFFSDQLNQNQYDVITFFEVIEHLPDVTSFLRRAEQLLTPGGIIYLTTPNHDSLDRRILKDDWPVYHREHLSYFTPNSLRNAVLSYTNLNIFSLITKNISPLTLKLISKKITPGFIRDTLRTPVYNGPIEENLRTSIDKSVRLQYAKRAINFILNLADAGNTIECLLQKQVTGQFPDKH